VGKGHIGSEAVGVEGGARAKVNAYVRETSSGWKMCIFLLVDVNKQSACYT
jgi:hypothetical protein